MLSLILSNSSMQQIPLSLSTKAPLRINVLYLAEAKTIHYNLRLENKLASIWIACHIGGKTDRTGPFARSILPAGRDFVGVL